MPSRIHYHSDCAFFAGCENMLVNFWSSPAIRANFHITFSYRESRLYREGLHSRVKPDFPLYPLGFPDPSEILPAPLKPRLLRGALRFGSRLLFTVPLLLYEVWVLSRLLHRAAPDIVHINNGGYPAALSARAAALAARLAGVPSIMVVNNLAAGYRDPMRWLEYPLDRLVARSVQRFVTGSNAAAVKLKATLRLAADRCVSINNGIKLRQPSESVRATRQRLGLDGFTGVVFGIIAVMEPRKGHRVLFEAMTRLRRTEPNLFERCRLIIEGDGLLRRELESFAVQHDLKQACIFVGSEPHVMNLFAAIDVLVLASIDFEDFPNVVLEAMGYSKAVIASRLAGTPEQVVDGETGYLVPPGDSEALAGAMARLCADPSLASTFGRNGLERFEQSFTAEVATGRYVALYKSIIEAQHI